MLADIKSRLLLLKKEMEANIPFIKSELFDLNKPSVMGNSGLAYYFDSDGKGLGITYWETGVFEIGTDIVENENNDNSPFYFFPESYADKYYPKESEGLFFEKINELLLLLRKKYPNIKPNLE